MEKLTENLDIISNLPNQPTESAEELKKQFDKAGNIIKNYLNSKVQPAVENLENGQQDYLTITNFNDYKEEQEKFQSDIDEKLEGYDDFKTQTTNKLNEITKYNDFAVEQYSYAFNLNGPFANAYGDKTIEKRGYYPLAIAGFDNTQIDHGTVQRVILTSRNAGSGLVSYTIHNRDDEAKSGTLTVYVLWVKIK